MSNVILILYRNKTYFWKKSGVSLILSLFTVKTVRYHLMVLWLNPLELILIICFPFTSVHGYHRNILCTKQNVCQEQNVICGLTLPTSRALLCWLEKVKTDTAGLTLLYLLTQPGTQQNRSAWLGFKYVYIVLNKSK